MSTTYRLMLKVGAIGEEEPVINDHTAQENSVVNDHRVGVVNDHSPYNDHRNDHVTNTRKGASCGMLERAMLSEIARLKAHPEDLDALMEDSKGDAARPHPALAALFRDRLAALRLPVPDLFTEEPP